MSEAMVSATQAASSRAGIMAAMAGQEPSAAPLHAGPETVVSPDLVEHAYSAFRDFDWAEPELVELQTLFLRAARVVGDRSLDLSMSLRELIARQMESTGVAPQRIAAIRGFVPVGSLDRASLYEEALPPGLILATGEDDAGQHAG